MNKSRLNKLNKILDKFLVKKNNYLINFLYQSIVFSKPSFKFTNFNLPNSFSYLLISIFANSGAPSFDLSFFFDKNFADVSFDIFTQI